MPDSTRPIPVPWRVRLKHLGIHWFQGPLFLASLLVLVWMWSGRMSAVSVVGQVEVVQVDVVAPTSGQLMPLEETLSRFDRVEQGVALIARIDVSEALNEMQELTAERKRLQALIASESERVRLDQRRFELDQQQQRRDAERQDLDRQRNRISHREQLDDLRRESSELQQQRRELELRRMELAVQQGTEKQALAGLRLQRQKIDDLVRRNMATSLRLDELDAQIGLKQEVIRQNETLVEAVAKQIADLDRELAESRSRWSQASQAWEAIVAPSQTSPDDLPVGAEASVDDETLLEPLVRALAVQDARIQTLAERMAGHEIRAPISGMITQIHQPPGTYVRNGDRILTIAGEGSRWIVAYLDQRYRDALRPADRVEIRVRGGDARGARIGFGTVSSLGAQYELVPEHLRRNPEWPQWGLPVRIAIPDGLTLVPGEMVDLMFAVARSDVASPW